MSNGRATLGQRLASAHFALRLLLLLSIGLVLLLAVAVVSLDHPAFPPPCLLAETTGLHCAGCGGTRAARALLGGEFLAAVRFNPLLVLSLPALLAWSAVRAWTFLRGRDMPRWRLPPLAGWLIATAFVAFSILRNVPGFEWLGPAGP